MFSLSWFSVSDPLPVFQAVLRRRGHHAAGGGHGPDRDAHRAQRHRLQVRSGSEPVNLGAVQSDELRSGSVRVQLGDRPIRRADERSSTGSIRSSSSQTSWRAAQNRFS